MVCGGRLGRLRMFCVERLIDPSIIEYVSQEAFKEKVFKMVDLDRIEFQNVKQAIKRNNRGIKEMKRQNIELEKKLSILRKRMQKDVFIP
jgi:hypothetical protein